MARSLVPNMNSYLVDGLRTPIGRFRGALASLGAVELAVTPARFLVERYGPDSISRAVIGNVLQTGNGQNLARQVARLGGFAATTYALTLNDVCLSSMTSVALAADHVDRSSDEAWLVGGADSMSRADVTLDPGRPTVLFSDGLTCAIEGELHGRVADRDDARLSITRADADAVALASFERATDATRRGFLDDEVVPVTVGDAVVHHDEGLRETSARALGALAPAFSPDGTVTPGNASQMSDGAALGLVAGRRWVADRGITPLARIAGCAHIAGADGSLHERPAEAAERLLAEADLAIGDVDVWEINEAFAGVVVASERRLGLDLDVVNVNGGAIAIGHPLAASGFRLVLTLARTLRDRNAQRGVAAMCGGGGQGAAVLLERTSENEFTTTKGLARD